MKRSIIYITACATSVLWACERPAETAPGAGQPVDFGLRLEQFTNTRALDPSAVNYPLADYFSLGAGFDRLDVSAAAAAPVTYAYAAGALSPVSDPLRFPVDGSPMDVDIVWPQASLRTASVKDQTTKTAFLAADVLTFGKDNLQPTGTVLVTLRHAHPKITFVLGGANTGRKITALSIAGWQAYCDPAAGVKCAQLMVTAGDAAAFDAAVSTGSMGLLHMEGAAETFVFTLDQDMDAASWQDANYNFTLTINL